MKTIDNDAFESAFDIVQSFTRPFVFTSGGILDALMSAMNKDDSEMTPLEVVVLSLYEFYLRGGSKNVGT